MAAASVWVEVLAAASADGGGLRHTLDTMGKQPPTVAMDIPTFHPMDGEVIDKKDEGMVLTFYSLT